MNATTGKTDLPAWRRIVLEFSLLSLFNAGAKIGRKKSLFGLDSVGYSIRRTLLR
jgi:hypothetical protein